MSAASRNWAIRAATRADAEEIGALVANGLAAKVTPAFGERGASALASLVSRDVHRPAIRYVVADVDGEVVGSARLAVAQEIPPDGMRQLAKAIGWQGAIRGSFVLGMFSHPRLGADEAYIEELVVRDDWRRRGIACDLLAECESLTRAAGKSRVTLWTAAWNTPAITLYERQGFRVVRRRRTLRGKLLFDTPVACLMEKLLGPDAAAK